MKIRSVIVDGVVRFATEFPANLGPKIAELRAEYPGSTITTQEIEIHPHELVA